MTTDTPRTRLDAIRALLERRDRDGTTHWDGCETYHIDCAAWRLLKVVDAANAATTHDRAELWERLDGALSLVNEEVPT